MQISKKATSLCAIAVGAAILATSAFADVMIGSGYNSLKNAAKTTTAKLTKEVDGFSINVSASLKVDGQTVAEENEKVKYDIANGAHESTGTNLENGKTNETYYYNDKEQSIHKDSETGVYHVYQKTGSNSSDDSIINNPFEEEQAEDAEKIVDAFVGNLQDIIQVEESDGNKIYMGNLTDAQVPPLVNAISSYILKYSIFNEYRGEFIDIPYPKTNIYVIEASGKAVENENGIITSVIGNGSISGTDKDGNEHIYTAEFSIDVTDIDNTTVTAPDLSGQEVEYSSGSGESGFDERYIGIYKNNIIEQKDNTFTKKGERVLEITSVEDGNINGRYYEVYMEGYAPDEVTEFEFTGETNNEFGNMQIKYYQDGEEKTGVLHTSVPPNINAEFDVIINKNGKGWSSHSRKVDFNSDFIRVLD